MWCHGFLQQTLKKFLALAQHFKLPLFLADVAALTLLSHDAVRQRDRMTREPHCSFFCTGRPITSFALQANLWKYDVSDAFRPTDTAGQLGSQFNISVVFVHQPAFLLAAQQKGFELLELRGEDPRLASLDTLSGEELPLHFLFRLHSYSIHVGGVMNIW